VKRIVDRPIMAEVLQKPDLVYSFGVVSNWARFEHSPSKTFRHLLFILGRLVYMMMRSAKLASSLIGCGAHGAGTGEEAKVTSRTTVHHVGSHNGERDVDLHHVSQ
jgi:hypothetical protein